jgi:hypothetical protein
MTDSVQNLLRGLRLKSENTEDGAARPILRVCAPGVVGSAASGDGACGENSGVRTPGEKGRNAQI